MTFPKTRAVTAALACFTALALSGCTVKKTEAPALAGPSETGLSIRTTVTPDILDQDGFSQSVVEMTARGPDGRPVRAVPLRVEISVGGLAVDFGRLSSRNVVTGDDGIARVTYTSPPAPVEAVDTFTVVTLTVTPVGGDFSGTNPRVVDLRLVPRGVLLPPNGAPAPAFVFSPTPVTTSSAVTFNASSTVDEGVPCNGLCSYAWDFGDGSSGTGMVVSHTFRAPGSYIVRLTVVDQRGQSATTSQNVVVVASDPPKADFVFSPAAPRPGQDIFFNAQASTAASGHRIVFYEWDFGSGRFGEGVTVSKRYDTPGTYNVTLKVEDDAGGTAVVTKSITVAALAP